jgi:1,6-anhydro-N-acetylmuramate kinase
MSILRVRDTKILNFKSAQSSLSILFACAARELLRKSSLELGGVRIHGSEDRRIFSDPSQISTILEHGVNIRARQTGTE